MKREIRDGLVALVMLAVGGCVIAQARAQKPDGSLPVVQPGSWIGSGLVLTSGLTSGVMNACGGAAQMELEGVVCADGYTPACYSDAGAWCEKKPDPCWTLTPVQADGGRLRRYYVRNGDGGIVAEDVPDEQRCLPGYFNLGNPYIFVPETSRPINLFSDHDLGAKP